MDNVEQIMSKPVATCRPYDTLNAAAQIMWERDCGSVPITDDAGVLVGMITDRDICMAAYTKGAPLTAIPISDVMATPVYSCHADDSLDAAVKLMAEQQLHRVPVVNGANVPLGMLTLNDIARWAAAARPKRALAHGVAQTLAAISEPRSNDSHAIQVRAPAELVATDRRPPQTVQFAERP